MLVMFTDAQTDLAVAVNPNFVVVVFIAKDENGGEKTVINTTTGNLVVKEEYVEVIGTLQGQL